MARLEDETSITPVHEHKSIVTNALFEMLEDWEHQLTRSDFNTMAEPQAKRPQL